MKVIFYKKASEINNVKSAICLAHLYDNIFLYYIKNYKIHNSKFYASYMKNPKYKEYSYYLYGKCYFITSVKRNTWAKQVKNFKRLEKLKIFK